MFLENQEYFKKLYSNRERLTSFLKSTSHKSSVNQSIHTNHQLTSQFESIQQRYLYSIEILHSRMSNTRSDWSEIQRKSQKFLNFHGFSSLKCTQWPFRYQVQKCGCLGRTDLQSSLISIINTQNTQQHFSHQSNFFISFFAFVVSDLWVVVSMTIRF